MQRRVISASIILAIIFSGFIFKELQFIPVLLTAIFSAFCVLELTAMLKRKGLRVFHRVAILGVLAMVLEAALTGMQYTAEVFGITAVIAWIVRMPGRVEGAFSDVSATCFALVYVGLPFAAATHIFLSGAEGRAWLLVTLFIIWTTDSMALLVGREYGRTKLMPRISPGKTVEGAFAGIGGALIVVLITAAFFSRFFPGVTALEWVVFAVGFSILGQFGDLAESLLKRDFGVKDSGSRLTGHGGFLDLLDSLLFVAIPLLAFLQVTHPEVLTR